LRHLRTANGFSPGDSTVDFGVRLQPKKFGVGRDFWHLHPLTSYIRRGNPAVRPVVVDLRATVEGRLELPNSWPRGPPKDDDIASAIGFD
jgi:hypothetical protein